MKAARTLILSRTAHHRASSSVIHRARLSSPIPPSRPLKARGVALNSTLAVQQNDNNFAEPPILNRPESTNPEPLRSSQKGSLLDSRAF